MHARRLGPCVGSSVAAPLLREPRSLRGCLGRAPLRPLLVLTLLLAFALMLEQASGGAPKHGAGASVSSSS